MAIPFLGILFDKQAVVSSSVPFSFNVDSIEHNFNYFLSQIIVNNGKAEALVLVGIIIIVMVFFKTTFSYFSNYIMAGLRTNVVKDIRNDIFSKILHLPLFYFSDERKGDIIARMTGDVQEIETSIVRALEAVFREPVTIIVYIITLFFMSFRLTIFVFILLPLTGLVIGRIGKNLRKKSLLGQTKMGVLLSMIEETLSGLRIIKAFNSESRMEKNFYDENSLYTKIMIKMWHRNQLAIPLSEFLGTVVIVIIMWYGGTMVLNHQSSLTSQAFIGYIIIFSQIINPAKSFSSAYYSIQKGLASVERVNKITSADNPIKEKKDAKPISEFKESIEYKDVSFKYKKEEVLKNISIKIKKGKTIAIVGQSGSGKSTLVDLLPRFYDVLKGDILVDGVSVRDYKIFDLRNLMGNVNQESILFNDTVFNNIAFGVKDPTLEQVIEAAKVANAHEFIEKMPEGYQTMIGDRGGKLSGGQRQRISIARAVLKNPPIMILDEATSSLDTESERLVQDALENLMKNRTSIVIAHRLSTVKNADEIYVLRNGEIIEKGTHSELEKLNGAYKKLLTLQMV